jgi:hypothetical protein
MEYKYHCQPQAKDYARQVIPVPLNYPLRDSLPVDYRTHFEKLCELMRNMYLDMEERPEAYGLKLLDISSTDPYLIRASKNSIHRLFDTLYRLFICGSVSDNKLTVSKADFTKLKKKDTDELPVLVTKYELILSRLVDFGFVISDFSGKQFGKNIESFDVEYPDYPDIIGTLKTYCECWHEIKTDLSRVKIWPEEFHHHSYSFDYKITSDLDKVPVQQWISDESKYYGYPDEIGDFYVAFYEYSLKYKGVKFNGDYNYKSKRIARDLQKGLGKCSLSLILRNMDKYITELEAMPDSIKQPFTKSNCNHCGFQGSTLEYCKFRRNWTLDGVSHEACAFFGFQFNDFDPARIPDYWRLLELDYDLKKE